MKNQRSIKPGQSMLLISTSIILMFIIQIVGCSDCNKSKTPPPPTVSINSSLIDCLVGKKIKLTGVYAIPGGGTISVSREAEITQDHFKVDTTRTDEIPEEAQIINWQGHLIEVTPSGNLQSNDSACYKIKYKSNTFKIGDKECVFEASGEICDDCTILSSEWKLICGGNLKAKGPWEIVDPE